MKRIFFLLICSLVGCGGESASTSGFGGSGAAGQAGAGGVGPEGGGGADAGGAGGGGEIRCGGAEHLKCPEGYFCGDGACGLTGSLSTCSLLPEDCPMGGTPVCGCDAKAYPNACRAIANGQGRCFGETKCSFDISNDITCEPPAGYFACGTIFCEHGKEFCELLKCLAGWQTSTCKPLPSTCGASPTCDCTKEDGFTCESSPSGDLTLTQLMGPDFCL